MMSTTGATERIRPSKPATVQRDEARNNRHRWIEQTILMVRILSFHYPSHLMRKRRGYQDAWNWLVCIHVPTGPIAWMLTPDEEAMFEHLPRDPIDTPRHPWNGATTQDKIDCLRAMESPTKAPRKLKGVK